MNPCYVLISQWKYISSKLPSFCIMLCQYSMRHACYEGIIIKRPPSYLKGIYKVLRFWLADQLHYEYIIFCKLRSLLHHVMTMYIEKICCECVIIKYPPLYSDQSRHHLFSVFSDNLALQMCIENLQRIHIRNIIIQ